MWGWAVRLDPPPKDMTPRRLVDETDWGITIDVMGDGSLDVVVRYAEIGDLRLSETGIRRLTVDHLRVDSAVITASAADHLTVTNNWVGAGFLNGNYVAVSR